MWNRRRLVHLRVGHGPDAETAAAVYRTAELLEDILRRVDIRTLLLPQRVSGGTISKRPRRPSSANSGFFLTNEIAKKGRRLVNG